MRHNYENLEIYKRSLGVAVKIMSIIDEVRPFRLAEQISSASISIPSNIAEGSERGSNKEFLRFLQYSSGSASELLTQLTVVDLSGKQIGLDLSTLISEVKEINSMIRGLMNSLKNQKED
jgi:four helix bundle protein